MSTKPNGLPLEIVVPDVGIGEHHLMQLVPELEGALAAIGTDHPRTEGASRIYSVLLPETPGWGFQAPAPVGRVGLRTDADGTVVINVPWLASIGLRGMLPPGTVVGTARNPEGGTDVRVRIAPGAGLQLPLGPLGHLGLRVRA